MRKLFYVTCLILITCSFNSCELLGDGCQVCRTVSYLNDNEIAWGTESEYCGDKLIAIKATTPVTTGGVTTKWECR